MSHVVQIETQIRDATAVRAACRRLGLAEPVQGKVKLFSAEAQGLAVQLPRWQYPVVCDTTTGKVQYDNFQGRWGDPRELSKFLQAYAVELCRLEARRKGHTVLEQELPGGAIKLVVQVQGGGV